MSRLSSAWLMLVFTSIGCSTSRTADDESDVPLSSTVGTMDVHLTPHLSEKLGGGNTVFCGTFKLVWDLYGSAHWQQVSDKTTARKLNELIFSESDFPTGELLATIGDADSIRKELNLRFPGNSVVESDVSTTAGMIAFSYFRQTAQFMEAFDILDSKIEFGDATVKCFGIDEFSEDTTRDTRIRYQVGICDYSSPDDFILELETVGNVRLTLAKVVPKESIGKTLADVERRKSLGNSSSMDEYRIRSGETIRIPFIQFSVKREFPELVPNQDRSWQAIQFVDFVLDESGVKLESYAEYDSLGGRPHPRLFVFDKPFLIYLKCDSSKNPYFAAWIGNAKVMQRIDELVGPESAEEATAN